MWRVTPRTVYSHASTQLLVLAARYDDDGRAWLRVALPIRPNRSTGWISADSVRVDHTGYFVSVRTRARDVRVFRHGRQLRRFLAVVGAPATPTPHGLFAVYERTRQLDPNGFIGPWALHLTAFSDVLENFGGGPGRTAIHGRGPAALGDPLGTERSHGCVRVDNSTVQWLRRRLGPGTPVKIS